MGNNTIYFKHIILMWVIGYNTYYVGGLFLNQRLSGPAIILCSKIFWKALAVTVEKEWNRNGIES